MHTRFDINDRIKNHMSHEGVLGFPNYIIGRTVGKNHKIKWMLDAIEHINKWYDDPVLQYDYYIDFRKHFTPLLHATFKWDNGAYIRKNADELSLEDIKKLIEPLAQRWDELDRFLNNPESLYEKVHRVDRIIKLLKAMTGYDFDDKKLWIFHCRDCLFYIDIYDSGDMNPNQKYDDMDNPEDDNDMEPMNPDKANKNPQRRRIGPVVENPEDIPDVDNNPISVAHLLHQLKHYI